MKYGILALVAFAGLAGCSTFDQWLPRDAQCMLFQTAVDQAKAQGVKDVDAYIDELVKDGVVVCPVPAVDVQVK